MLTNKNNPQSLQVKHINYSLIANYMFKTQDYTRKQV